MLAADEVDAASHLRHHVRVTFIPKPLQASATIRKLADIANKVSESHGQSLPVASITNGPTPKPQDDNVSLLLGEVRSL